MHMASHTLVNYQKSWHLAFRCVVGLLAKEMLRTLRTEHIVPPLVRRLCQVTAQTPSSSTTALGIHVESENYCPSPKMPQPRNTAWQIAIS